jgi:hypothetical protein
MQKELADRKAIPGKIAFQGPNILKPLLPNLLMDESRRYLLGAEELRVDAHHQSLFIIRAIKDAQATSFRKGFQATP